MNAILNPIVKYIESGDIYLVFIIAFIGILFNFSKISYFLEKRKRTKIERISEALKCNQIDGSTKEFLEEQISNEHFKLATGLGIEKKFRETIIDTHQKANGELSFIHFKRALPYLSYENAILEIKISWFEKSLHWFNWAASFLMTAFGMFLFLLLNFSKNTPLSLKIQLFMLGVVCVLIAIFMIFQTFPVRSANLVNKELLKQQKNK